MNIGDKVVCIDGLFHPQILKLYTALPTQGVTYVIRDVRLGIQPDCCTGDVSVTLIGVVNPKAESRSALERGFSSSRFRPLQEQKEVQKECRQLREQREKEMSETQ